jgi:soluble lytic murein transglycosylase
MKPHARRARPGRIVPALAAALLVLASPGAARAATSPAASPACTRDCAKPAPAPAAARPAPARPAAAPRAAEFAGADDAFLAARTAALRGDEERFEQAARQVGAGHPLAAYLDLWRLRRTLAETRTDVPGPADDEARAFVAKHAGTLVADLARRDWLMSLGRRQVWGTFDTVLPDLVQRDDAVRCHALASRAAGGERVMAEARELVLAPRELGEACNSLVGALVANGQMGPADLWRRLEAALESGVPATVRRAAAFAAPTLDGKALDAALARPAAVLAGAPSREAAVVALATLARTDPAEAAEKLAAVAPKLRAADRSFAWSQIAAGGMRRLLPESHAWTLEARAARPSDETLAWMTRAALRAGDWPTVRSTIERMTESGRADPAWTYWLGRALQARRDDDEAQHRARVLFTSIAGRHDFYAQLAAEELGMRVTVPAPAPPPTEAERAEAQRNPGFARARAFYELGLRLDGNREWNFQLRGMGDRQLIAAAEHASRTGLLDRAVAAADRTRDEHDFALRFPAPFAERLEPIARAQGLDPAWVYGLIRQESRFVSDARSSVGASGLMQIMPGTAKWIAKKMGVRDFEPGRINELDTNLQFGTFYLKTVFDDLDRSPVLASAAYNAGPGRPRSWRGTLPQTVEGAVFAEIVPFTETRGYVKHVLSNTAWYAARFTGEPQSLKALLGEVRPGPAATATASPGGD